MRSLLVPIVAVLTVNLGLYAGCAAGGDDRHGGDGSGGDTGAAGAGATGTAGFSAGGGLPEGGMDPDASCAKFSAEAEQAPAAMLTVLDMTASMQTAGKWGEAQLAIVAAIDKDVFDSMSLGLVTFPSSTVAGPACIYGFEVTCGVSALPQVAIAPAGKDKSNAPSGVRKQIYDYLVAHNPISSQDDGSPVYDAIAAGYKALKLYGGVDKRMMVLISDGGFSCTSLSKPQRKAFTDLNGCQDWEHPDNVNQLITQNRTDPNAPVVTFIVGVPGSDTNGGKTGIFDNPPYPMLLALSTYAVSGSPETVDPGCDKNAVFSQNGAPPAKPCHIDLSKGQFDANVLAVAIAKIRGQALGCVYPLPQPPPGQEIKLDQVNVNVTLDGVTSTVPKRSDPNDTCANDGCWDYTLQNDVELLGKTCLDLTAAAKAKVDILVGCATLLK
ncbi:MAG: hypothetical protein HY744_31125 [Deltaproteobacteria bacterium]|nr:hypothetical protein [Deltaproteobacteria bacterium]